MYEKVAQNYKSTQILTADPAKIVLMLLDGAMNFLERAAVNGDESNFPEKTKYLDKAYNIIIELLASLDYEAGGDIAANLREIYIFLSREIKKADLENDTKKMRECKAVLTNIRDAWAGIAKNNAASEDKTRKMTSTFSSSA